MPNLPASGSTTCPNCGSANIIHLKTDQEASSLPDIKFAKCRFCGNIFRENKKK